MTEFDEIFEEDWEKYRIKAILERKNKNDYRD